MYQCLTHLRHKPLDLFNDLFPLPNASVHALPTDRITQTNEPSHSKDTSLNKTEMKSHISVMSMLEADRARFVFLDVWTCDLVMFTDVSGEHVASSQVQNVSKQRTTRHYIQ